MKIAAIVPYMLPFGMIRRFLEVGNVMTARGHDYTIYSKDMHNGDLWMNYTGKMSSWKGANFTFKADVVLIADPSSLSVLDDTRFTISGKVYIWVVAAGIKSFRKQYKEYEAKGYPLILLTRMYRKHFGPNVELCEGGVNTSIFTPKTIRVGYYPSRGNHKGESHILESLDGLKHVIPVAIKGFDTPDLVKVYRSLDYFVCSETKSGWSNMSAEAVACGIPVVSDSENTSLFSDKVINVKSLRNFFDNPMEAFSWEKVCDRLLEIFAK